MLGEPDSVHLQEFSPPQPVVRNWLCPKDGDGSCLGS